MLTNQIDAAGLQDCVRLLGQKTRREIVELMQRPIVLPPKWFEYSPQFLSPARVNAGVQYWNDHAAEL